MLRVTALTLFMSACVSAPAATTRGPASPDERAAHERTIDRSPAPIDGTGVTSPARASARPTQGVSDPQGEPRSDGSAREWQRCGALECLRFADERDALGFVLETTHPRVLAIGESHAPKGSEGIPSTAHHLTHAWLPRLVGRASDLVVELPVPPRGCEDAKTAVVEKVERPVTATQRGDNRNEYLALASEAKRVGITPWALEPTCADMDAVAKAGDGSVVAMLELIATLTATRLETLHAKRASDALIVALGGALHNDVAPSAERASWSFGPALLAATKGRYVELDAFVPEHIKDSDSWKRMPFYAHYDASAHPDEATLFRLGPSAFVLVFPRAR